MRKDQRQRDEKPETRIMGDTGGKRVEKQGIRDERIGMRDEKQRMRDQR